MQVTCGRAKCGLDDAELFEACRRYLALTVSALKQAVGDVRPAPKCPTVKVAKAGMQLSEFVEKAQEQLQLEEAEEVAQAEAELTEYSAVGAQVCSRLCRAPLPHEWSHSVNGH